MKDVDSSMMMTVKKSWRMYTAMRLLKSTNPVSSTVNVSYLCLLLGLDSAARKPQSLTEDFVQKQKHLKSHGTINTKFNCVKKRKKVTVTTWEKNIRVGRNQCKKPCRHTAYAATSHSTRRRRGSASQSWKSSKLNSKTREEVERRMMLFA